MLGPGFSTSDVVSIAAFAVNYAIVAPVSAVCVLVALVRGSKGPPRWLVPIAVVNLIVVLPQLWIAAELEWWLTALLIAQGGMAVAVLVWLWRARRSRER